MERTAIEQHIFDVPPTLFMEKLLGHVVVDARPCTYEPMKADTGFTQPGDHYKVQSSDQPGQLPVQNYHARSTHERRQDRQRSVAAVSDQHELTRMMPPQIAEKLELHDPKGSVPVLAGYIFNIISSYRDLRRRASDACAAVSAHLEELHVALQLAQENDGSHTTKKGDKKVVSAVEKITRGRDPFGSLLDDLRQLAGQREEAIQSVEALKIACEKDIAKEDLRKKITAVALWVALAALLGVTLFGSVLNPAVLGGVGVAKGAADMMDLFRKRKEEETKEKKKIFDHVERSVSALRHVEKELERVVADYDIFKDFLENFTVRLQNEPAVNRSDMEEASGMTAEAQTVLNNQLGTWDRKVETVVHEASATVQNAAPHFDEKKLQQHSTRRPCCIIM